MHRIQFAKTTKDRFVSVMYCRNAFIHYLPTVFTELNYLKYFLSLLTCPRKFVPRKFLPLKVDLEIFGINTSAKGDGLTTFSSSMLL